MRPNWIRPTTPVVRRTRRSALVCVVFVLAAAITGAVSSGTPRAAGGKQLTMTFTFSPASGTHFQSPNQTATVTICSGAGVASASASLNGIQGEFDDGLRPSCNGGDKGTAPMSLNPGSNDLSISACDNNGDCSGADATYYYDVPPQYAMTVTAAQAADTFPSGSTRQASFTVKNTGNIQATVYWGASCSGGSLRCTGPTAGSFVLAIDSSQSTLVALSDTVQGTGSRVTFSAYYADSPSPVDSASTPVTVTAPAPSVSAQYSPLSVTAGITAADTFTVAVGPYGVGPYALSKTCDSRFTNCTLTPLADTLSANGSQRAVLTFGVPVSMANQSATVSVTAVGATAGSPPTTTPVQVTVGAIAVIRDSVSLDQSTLTLLVRDSTQARATATYANDSVVHNAPAAWSSSNAAVASVTANGFITAQGLGSTTITAIVGGVSGSATLVVSNPTGITASMQGINPQGSIAREQCLTIAAGDDAAYECGDLRLVHPLPGVRTMNRERAPTLIYNSRHSAPSVLIAVDVLVANVSPAPTSLAATLKIGGHTLTQSYTWNTACDTVVCRIVFPDTLNLPTGWYADSLQLTTSGGTYSASLVGGVAVVNRTTSPFGAGWWLDGLEQLAFVAGDTTKVLWVTGDGSTRVYRAAGAPDSVFTVQDLVDRPDTLIKSRADTTWRRHLGNNAVVQFNGGGQHIRTINRQGDTTRFVYDAITAALDSIILPTPSATRPAYTFQYDTAAHGHAYPVLTQVHSPGVTGSRTTTLAPTGAWQVTQITDPDNTTVGFTWDANNRIVSRRNRLSDTTTYSYDAAGALSKVSVSMSRTRDSALVTTFCAAETRTLAMCAGDGTAAFAAVPLASVVTRLDGPRTDVTDVTRFYVNRFGAPDTVVDARGGYTRVTRDVIFPALADAVIDPTGFEQDAVYNARGLLQSSTAKNPFGTGQDAITRYSYDAKWDFVDTITTPTNEVSYFSYDTATGNRLWQRTGPDTATTVRFFYNARNQVVSVLAPAHHGPQAVAYDPALGNDTAETTPMGFQTNIARDAIGEQVTVSTPTDADQTPSLRTVQQLSYDVMGRLRVDSTTSASFSYTTQLGASGTVPSLARVVRDSLDAEGTLLRRTRGTVPDTVARPTGTWFTTFTYDAAHRRRTRNEDGISDGHGNLVSDSTWYDPAGNPIRQRTRRGKIITQVYDALNRLTQRVVPGDSVPGGICGMCTNDVPANATQFPDYPTVLPGRAASRDVIIPQDVYTFSYDAAGHMRAALNGSAHIWRTYFANGSLQTERDSVHAYYNPLDSTTLTNPWGQHVYWLGYTYDLSGRRTARSDSVAWWSFSTQTYHYNARGLLDATTDGTVSHAFTWDAAGRLVGRAEPGVSETRGYDDDDRLTSRRNPAYQDVLTYDARGKATTLTIQAMNSSAMPYVNETSTMVYDGFGALVLGDRLVGAGSCGSGCGGNPMSDEYVVDAFGNVVRHDLNRGANAAGRSATVQAYASGARLGAVYADPLDSICDPSNCGMPLIQALDSTVYVADASGNQIQAITTVSSYATSDAGGSGGPAQMVSRYPSATNGDTGRAVSGDSWSPSRAKAVSRDQQGTNCATGTFCTAAWGQVFVQNYYDGAERLRVSQRTAFIVVDAQGNSQKRTTFEEYAYDALGRRVTVRTRKDSLCADGDPEASAYARDCLQTMDRFVWDGSDLLIELRDYGGWAQDAESSNALNLNGTSTGNFFGRVQYTHAAGVMGMDAPLFVQKNFNGAGFVPQANWHGTYEDGTNLDGGDMSSYSWPARRQGIYLQPDARIAPIYANAWYGSLIDGKVDANGLIYNRNRYYDPAAGQFTQEDPIGLAGGLNLYGFVGGDPINSSDPFGLCPACAVAEAGAEVGTLILPGPGTVIGAVVGGAIGAVGGHYLGKWLAGKLHSEQAEQVPRRSIDDPGSLHGATPEEVEKAVPQGWTKGPSSESEGGGGTRYLNPDRPGEAVRVMPGQANDPNPVKQGPYVKVSKDGVVSDPIPLSGNPTLKKP